jgi:hypothetical protein
MEKQRKQQKMYNEITDRTGHCGLNRYLHPFGHKNSPYCQCGYGKETVEHYLLECRNYREQRKKLRREVRVRNMRVVRLLGDTKLIGHTVEFIKATLFDFLIDRCRNSNIALQIDLSFTPHL